MVDVDAVRAAIEAVEDPEIHRSLGELGMVRDLDVDSGVVSVLVALTIPGCPLVSQHGDTESTEPEKSQAGTWGGVRRHCLQVSSGTLQQPIATPRPACPTPLEKLESTRDERARPAR